MFQSFPQEKNRDDQRVSCSKSTKKYQRKNTSNKTQQWWLLQSFFPFSRKRTHHGVSCSIYHVKISGENTSITKIKKHEHNNELRRKNINKNTEAACGCCPLAPSIPLLRLQVSKYLLIILRPGAFNTTTRFSLGLLLIDQISIWCSAFLQKRGIISQTLTHTHVHVSSFTPTLSSTKTTKLKYLRMIARAHANSKILSKKCKHRTHASAKQNVDGWGWLIDAGKHPRLPSNKYFIVHDKKKKRREFIVFPTQFDGKRPNEDTTRQTWLQRDRKNLFLLVSVPLPIQHNNASFLSISRLQKKKGDDVCS